MPGEQGCFALIASKGRCARPPVGTRSRVMERLIQVSWRVQCEQTHLLRLAFSPSPLSVLPRFSRGEMPVPSVSETAR